MKTYFCSKLPLCCLEWLKRLFPRAVLLFVFAALFQNTLPVLLLREFPIAAALLFCCYPLIPSLLWGFSHCNIQVEITDRELILKRGFFHKKESFRVPLTAQITPHIQQKKFHGLTYCNHFFLKVKTQNSFTVLPCHCLSADDFSLLSELVTHPKLEKKAAAPHSLFSESFRLPCEQILSCERKRLLHIILGCFLIGCLLAAAWFFFVNRANRNPNTLFLLLFIIGFFSLPVSIAQTVRYFTFAPKLPETVELLPSCIRIDEKSFYTEELSSVHMTLAELGSAKNNTSFRRRFILESENKNTEYFLGSTISSPKSLVWQDYERLIISIRSWCKNHDIPFYLDLT